MITSSIQGVVPPDEKFLKMLAVWNSCKAAGIPLPSELLEFFNWEEPDTSGVIISLRDSVAVSQYMGYGYEVDLSLIPEHIKKIRFSVSR